MNITFIIKIKNMKVFFSDYKKIILYLLKLFGFIYEKRLEALGEGICPSWHALARALTDEKGVIL